MQPKILIIGQAPPAQAQALPYDTTMLYEWLEECGISKEEAQHRFDFDAVSNVFPGSTANGHIVPSRAAMDAHWPTLRERIRESSAVIVLGRVAQTYLSDKAILANRPALSLMHPSRRNWHLFSKNRDAVLAPLRALVSPAKTTDDATQG